MFARIFYDLDPTCGFREGGWGLCCLTSTACRGSRRGYDQGLLAVQTSPACSPLTPNPPVDVKSKSSAPFRNTRGTRTHGSAPTELHVRSTLLLIRTVTLHLFLPITHSGRLSQDSSPYMSLKQRLPHSPPSKSQPTPFPPSLLDLFGPSSHSHVFVDFLFSL